MNEPRGIDIREITSLSNDEFHKERTWACLDIIDKICEPSPWH
jgi:hypothetical protein